ncbi:S-layer homology domain-containing protein, partial [Sedimentibacter sp. B4]|uniref:S-layer homology domain-containing protein n=1 Tax=Sedimentibacter sp. B4 TaxID=304766 RepID=UPI0005948930
MKKVLSLVLVIAMVLSSMSFAFAGTFEDVTGDYETAVEALSALGVIKGYEDGTFRPEKTITRAELAKVLVEALGYGKLVAGATSNFTDTQGHWANGYVAIAAGTGLVVGYPDGTFQPDKTVTYDEALTMVVRAIGYTDAALKGTWPTNYKVKAIDLGLTDDVTMNVAAADRGGVAQIIYNALEVALVTIDEDGVVVKVSPEKLLIDNIATLEEYYYVSTDKLDADDNDYAGDKVDLTPYVYQYLDVYTNSKDEVVYIKDNNSQVLSGTVTGVSGDDLTIEDAEGDEYTIKTDGQITVFYNGEQVTMDAADYEDLLYRGSNSAEAKITVISKDSLDTIKDGDSEEIESGDAAEKFIATKATEAILVDTDYVAGKAKISGENATIALPKDSDGDLDLDKVTVTGAVDSLEDIESGDVVVAYKAVDGAPVKLVVVKDSVEGTVTKTADSEATIYVDGTKYSLSRITNSVRYEDRPSVGDEGVFYLDNAGKIFAVDTDGEALTDYAVVLASAEGEYSTKMDGSVTDYPQLKLLTTDGETVVYDVLVTIDENALDDVAVYTDKTPATDVIDADLVSLVDIVSGETTGDIDFEYSFSPNQLIKYSVDENGYIDEIEIMGTTSVAIDTDDIEDITSEDVIVFNTVDKEVASVDNLVDGATHTVLYDDGEIVVIVTSNVESANDDVYGVISKMGYVKNSAGKTVIEVTAFIDGEEVVYLSEANRTIGSNGFEVSTSAAVSFDFGTDDEIDAIDAMAIADTYTTASCGDVTSTYIEIGSSTFRFAKDVAVYIYDESDDSISIGDVSDLDEARATTVYNTATTGGIANIVVQV